MKQYTDNWSVYVYEFDGGFYECGTQRFIYTFDTDVKECMFRLWISFLIADSDEINFNVLVDMAEFIDEGSGTYTDFME
jgi:hypothetical protein